MKYDIFAKLQDEIDDFDTGGYYIAGEPKSEVNYKGSKKGEKGGYYYSQKDTLESIDLASASKYKKGLRDPEGQRKTFINIVNFYRDVMKMKININVANYIFEPLSLDYAWPVWLMGRKFGIWAQEESYDDQIDEYGHDLATYGTTVSKKLRDNTERVPLRTLRNTQAARSLWHATSTGGYVIIEDDKHYNELTGYPGWDIKDLSKNKSYTTYERYALVPKSLYENEAWKTNGGVIDDLKDDDEMIVCQMVLIPEEKEDKNQRSGKIVWMEKVDEESFPLEECHAEKVDGRWLGRGEIEKQLENQIARNLNANLRRRGLLWAVKKVYQSTDDEVQKNLVMEVMDGEVVKVKPNGQITQVNTANQHTAEFNADDDAWKENSQQVSFAFNIATGENLPSGTSFSLGVVLDRAVTSHFSMVRNKYSNFLKRSFFDQLIPIFREEYSDSHTQQIPMGATDIENLQESMVTWHANDRYFNNLARRRRTSYEEVRLEVQEEMVRTPYLFVEIPDDFYPDAHFYMKLNIDDDTGPDIQTLTSLFQTMEAKGDPRSEQILKMILAKQGKHLDHIAGGRAQPVQPVNPRGAAPGETPQIPPEASPAAAEPVAEPTGVEA